MSASVLLAQGVSQPAMSTQPAIPGQAGTTRERRDFDAAIFDLDGVLTDTAGVHAAAGKTVFDAFLERRAQRLGVDFQPFDLQTNYLACVDMRPR
jgi:hypothetical protein